MFEWGFIGILVVLCIALTTLQYQWTGQLSRAEMEHLRTRLTESLRSLCTFFDATVARAYRELTPETNGREQPSAEDYAELFQDWRATQPPHLFKRIGYAVPKGKSVTLYLVQQDTGTVSRAPWPEDWKELQARFEARMALGHGPILYADPAGAFTILPVFIRSGVPGGPLTGRTPADAPSESHPDTALTEREWVIFELDLDYLRTVWLPELVAAYVGPNQTGLLAYVQVRTRTVPQETLFQWGQRTTTPELRPVRVDFHQGQLGHVVEPGGERSGGWTLEAGQSPTQLSRLAWATRRRNLTVAITLDALVVAAGLSLVHYTRRARLLAQTQMRFVANVSHELRTPLTVIRGASHNLADRVVLEGDREKVAEYAQLILHHSEALSTMVDQVLELGKARNGGLRPAGEVDVAGVLQEAVAATREETKDCAVDVQIAPNLRLAQGDAGALQRAFQNLLVNAARHGGKGGWIGVTGVLDEEQEPPKLEIQIADRGEGIPPEELTKIFEPFYRGAAAEAEQVRGSGLGLSLVKETVEAHGGTLSVESQTGTGTAFTVRLPLNQRPRTP